MRQPGHATSLPEALQRWVMQQTMAAPGDDVPPLRTPLVLERAGRRLAVRLMLHEQRPVRSATLLQSLHLTR